MSTVLRLLNYPITLIGRAATGGEDEWGSPIYADIRVSTVCYYKQEGTSDSDAEGTVVWGDYIVFLPPDEATGPYDAVEIDVGGGVETMEVIGQPDAELNARTGKVNHLAMKVRRAAA